MFRYSKNSKNSKNLERNYLPIDVSDFLIRKTTCDIVDFILIPYLFVRCRKCKNRMTFEDEKKSRHDTCPNCMFRICCQNCCSFLGCEKDFHQIPDDVTYNMSSLWFCTEHYILFFGMNNWSAHFQGSCTCDRRLLNPSYVEAIKRAKKLVLGRKFKEKKNFFLKIKVL
jgi:hypothetical protein